MDDVARQSSAERQVLFTETAARMGAPSAVIAEKDFWVCWTLHHLFALEFRPTLLFKGGTSLSKAFGLIERFSEDIDLTLNRGELGFAGGEDPLKIAGRKRRARQIKALAEASGRAVREELAPRLREAFARILGSEGWEIEVVERDDGQVDLHFRYPPALAPEDYGGLAYIAPLVRMEIGARSDQEPAERVAIRSYAAEHLPDVFTRRDTEVLVLAPERTFWEKATIFHAENHRPLEGDRRPPAWRQLSRHAYDLVMLERGGVAQRALERLDLLEAVARHKDAFFHTGWSRYSEARPGSLRLMPSGALVGALRADYAQMQPMFFGPAPSFDELMDALRGLEARINAMR
jgi:hypothetical protein